MAALRQEQSVDLACKPTSFGECDKAVSFDENVLGGRLKRAPGNQEALSSRPKKQRCCSSRLLHSEGAAPGGLDRLPSYSYANAERGYNKSISNDSKGCSSHSCDVREVSAREANSNLRWIQITPPQVTKNSSISCHRASSLSATRSDKSSDESRHPTCEQFVSCPRPGSDLMQARGNGGSSLASGAVDPDAREASVGIPICDADTMPAQGNRIGGMDASVLPHLATTSLLKGGCELELLQMDILQEQLRTAHAQVEEIRGTNEILNSLL